MSEQTAKRTAWLVHTDAGYIYISPTPWRGANANAEMEVGEQFVLQHLHSMPRKAVRFDKSDRSYMQLLNHLMY